MKPTLDLNEEYKRLNELIFSSQLPEDVMVSWTRARRFGGVTTATFDTESDEFLSAEIRINSFFESTETELLNILIHEMIHVKQALLGGEVYRTAAHGPSFQEEMERINRDFPRFHISPTQKDFRKINRKHLKERHGFAVYLRDGGKMFNLYKERIERDQFLLILHCYNHLPDFDGAFVYTFNGFYDFTGHSVIRRNEKSLVSHLQIPHEKMKGQIFQYTEKDMEYSYRVENESTHFVLNKNNSFSYAVYPEFHRIKDIKIELMKMMVEV